MAAGDLVDLPRCSGLWSEQDRGLYNRLPIYLAKTQVDYIKWSARFSKILKPKKWEANMGTTMRGVRKEPSPVLRSEAFPNKMTQLPKKDIIRVRETSEDCELYRHNFESELLHFEPSFFDFLTDHVDYTNKDMTEKVMQYSEHFYRGAIFHGSPTVFVCGAAEQLKATAHWVGPTISPAKTQAVLQALIAQCTRTLDLDNINLIGQMALNDIAMTPFQGSLLADGSNGEALKHKYCLIMGNEPWQNFYQDPFTLANRQINLDIITNDFTGSLFNRFTTLFERFELRIAADGTIPVPETIELNPDSYNIGETIPNPPYVNAPFAVAFLCGAEAYKYIQVGPPPPEFAKGEMSMKQFRALDWNGKVSMTKDVMVPCLDDAGATVFDTNKRGEYVQLISDVALGIMPIRRRNILPIIYMRARVSAN